MTKAHSPINWQNSPSVSTPINESNLNKMDKAIGVIDDRVVSLDTTKANQTDMLTAITNVTFDESTGMFTFTRKNGTTVKLDTKLEKLILNWNYDKNKQILYLILSDGSQMPIDLSSLISQYEFVDSSTIRWVIGTDSKVAAEIIKGTITDEMLEPNYLANVELYASQALESANDARTYADNASTSASQADGNAKLSEQYAKRANDAAEVVNQKLKLATFSFDANGHLIYSDYSAYAFTVDNTRGMLQYELAQ